MGLGPSGCHTPRPSHGVHHCLQNVLWKDFYLNQKRFLLVRHLLGHGYVDINDIRTGNVESGPECFVWYEEIQVTFSSSFFIYEQQAKLLPLRLPSSPLPEFSPASLSPWLTPTGSGLASSDLSKLNSSFLSNIPARSFKIPLPQISLILSKRWVHLSPRNVASLANLIQPVPKVPEELQLLFPPRTGGCDVVSRGPEASMTSHHCRKPCTESLTEHPTKWSEKYFLILGFEKVLEEEASKEERGPATSSEDRDGPKTARGSPVVHLSRYKSCGDNNLHTSTQWGQESWGKCSRPGPPQFQTSAKLPENATSASCSAYCGWEPR